MTAPPSVDLLFMPCSRDRSTIRSVAISTSIAAGRTGAGALAAVRPVADGRPKGHTRRLRISAWALSRALRDPRRLPASWSGVGFAGRVDRVRAQLLPIVSLSALVDCYAREHGRRQARTGADRLFRDAEVDLAYALRWLELTGRLDERPWRLLCGPGPV
jgi:hypothetical protein